MKLIPCMGGWCGKRDHCAHYFSPNAIEPVERLCAQAEKFKPVAIYIEKKHERQEVPALVV